MIKINKTTERYNGRIDKTTEKNTTEKKYNGGF